jgi:hypothetical protein
MDREGGKTLVRNHRARHYETMGETAPWKRE